jgi:hypothetical protein
MVVGLVVLSLGLAWDARLHRLDRTLAAREGPLSMANRAHATFAMGQGLVLGGASMLVLGTSFLGGWRRRVVGTLGAIGIVGVGLAPLAMGGRANHVDSHTSALVAAPTPEQRAAADRLVLDTRRGIARFVSVDAALAEGYYQTTGWSRGSWGHAHFHNRAFSRDAVMLDAQRPEGLVFLKSPDGTTRPLGALYLALKGQGVSPGGPLTTWHRHDNLCVDNATAMVVPVVDPRRCPRTATLLGDRVEMLHVWTFDNPDGPFAMELSPRAVRAAMD